MNNETKHPKKWYQYPYVWLLIAIPLSAVIMGVIMLRLVSQSQDGLVVDDYYQQGKNINRVIQRDEKAASLGLQGTLNINTDEGTINLNISHKQKMDFPSSLLLRFLHATRTGIDKDIELSRTPANTFQGFLPDLVSGRWYLQLGTQDWRLLGEWQSQDKTAISLSPAELHTK